MLNVAELDERIEKCLSILAENPHSQVFAALADTYRKRGDFGRAFSVCKSGLKKHPDYAPAHIILAKLYLHQGMHAEANASLARAVEIDGPTRAGDLLQAEILLAKGDAASARSAIEQLRKSDPKNKVVKDLLKRIRDLLSQRDSRQSMPMGETAESAGKDHELQPAPEIERCQELTWDEWAEEVGALPSVERVFALGISGDVLAGVSDDDDSIPSEASEMISEIDAALRDRLKIRLEELRIERPGGEFWCRRDDTGVIGFTGSTGLPFGAVRQSAIWGASRASASGADPGGQQ
jgi:predicted Zn-dependent protease